MVRNINLLESRRRILLNTPHIETISDTIASFETDVATKIKGCKVYFTPIQEGEGDPSPDNVRPIHGWDGVTVTACGKNLAPPLSDTEFWSIKAWFDGNGVIHNITSYIMCDYKKALPGVTYHLTMSNNTWRGIGFYDLNYKPIGFIQYMKSIQLTSPNNAAYYRIYAQPSSINIQLELGSEPTDYEPYNATALTIPFPQTIYGGYVDLINGEVVEEWKYLELDGTETWTKNSGTQYATDGSYRFQTSVPKSYWTNTNKPIEDGITNYLQPRATGDLYYKYPDSFALYASRYYVRLPGISEVEDLKAYLTNNVLQTAYKLETPNIYSLTPQTIKTLKGINNIWSDANGNIEVSFYTH